MKSYLNAICCRVLVAILAATAPWLGAIADDFTATDAQGVIYNKVPGTKNVIISAQNANMFRNSPAELVIPATITDISTSTMGKSEEYNVVGMEAKAFYGTKLKSIVIEAQIPEIPDSAFCPENNNSNLVSVTLPSSIKRIGRAAFFTCRSITSLNIDNWDNLEEVGDSAFYSCWNISKITLDAPKLTKIGSYAFYSSKVISASLPSLEELGHSAFYSNSSLTSLSLGDNLKVIPNYAFANCSGLRQVTLPENLEEIGEYAFNYCSMLTIANQWPANLRSVGGHAFYNCSNFGKLTLKPGTSYGEYAFQSCNIPEIDWGDGYAELHKGCFRETRGYSEVTLPDWMKEVPEELFYNTQFQTLTVNDNVEKLGSRAFYNCYRLSTVTLGKGLKMICGSALGYCSQLKTITLPAGVSLCDGAFYQNYLTTINFPEEPLYFRNEDGTLSSPFRYSVSLTSFTFPKYITEIADDKSGLGFFYRCSALTTVDASSITEAIPEYTFRELSKLTSVTLSPELKRVDRNAFYKCTSLTTLNCTASEWLDPTAFTGCTKLATLTLGSAYVWIGTIPTSVTTLKFAGEWARMQGNTTRNHSKNIKYLEFLPGVKHIGDSCFMRMDFKRSITFSEGIETIGDYAFYYTYNNKPTVFPKSLKRIGKCAFAYYCDEWANTNTYHRRKVVLDLPNIEYVGYKAFYQYPDVYNIILPENRPVEIEPYAFACPGVVNFTIPSWMEKVPAGMLSGVCDHNREIFFASYHWDDKDPFGNVAEIGSELRIPDTVKEIGDSAFMGYSSTAIVLPSKPTKIGKFAFAVNDTIHSFNIPDYMDELPDGFFYNWSKLEEIGGYDKLTRLGAYVMAGTVNFQLPLEFSNQIEYIGPYAFYCAKSVPEYEQSGFDRWVSLPGVEIFENTVLDKYALAGAPFESIDFKGCRTSLPEGCLRGVYAPKGINLPTCMDEIPDSLFMGSAFATNDLPITSNIKRIGNYAFAGAKIRSTTPLTLTIPESVEEIGECAFNDLRIPTELNKYNPSFCDIEVVLPKTPVKLGRGAFANMGKLVKINLPAYITELPDSCFRGFRWYKKELPYTLTIEERDGSTYPKKLNVGYNALLGATADKFDLSDHEVTLHPHSFFQTHIPEISLPETVTEVPTACFAYSDIAKMDLSDNLTCVGDSAFLSCESLTKVTIPNLPNTIKSYTFSDCPLLEEISIPDNVTEFETYAFNNLPSLAALKIPDSMTYLGPNMIVNCSGLKKLDLGKGLRIIGDNLFKDYPIEELTWPSTLIQVGNNAFAGTKVKHLYFPDGFDPYNNGNSNYGMRSNIFAGCTELETVTFGNVGVYNVMGTNMFQNCTALKKVDFGPTLRSITNYAFDGCTSLSDVNFDNIKSIGDYAFRGCVSLEGDFTFDNVTYVGSYGLSGCEKITKVHFKQPDITLLSLAFSDIPALTEVEFDGSVNNNWGSGFYNDINLKTFKAGGKIGFGGHMFRNCTSLTDVILTDPHPVQFLQSGVFESCTSLKTFPYLQYAENMEGANSIFDNCTSLREIVLPEKGDYVKDVLESSIYYNNQGIFSNCADLQSFIVPYSDGRFRMAYTEIKNAPLEGISYSYATDIEVYPQSHVYPYNNDYYNKDENTYDPKAILYVKRGQRWKYLEAGYGQRFEIIEMKEPVINIEGNLFADYDVTNNVNHYLGYLRWQLALSDLKENDATVAKIYRKPIFANELAAAQAARRADGDENSDLVDNENSENSDSADSSDNLGELIATVTFSAPSAPKMVEGYSQEVVEVVMTVDTPAGSSVQTGFDSEFTGGFELPVSDYNGNVHYEWIAAPTQSDKIYFDATTTKRLNTFDNYNATSWVILCDHFDSPDLASEKVPVAYTYSAEVVPYTFEKFVNNPNCDEIDGKRYKTVTESTAQFKSTPKTFNAVEILPTIDFEGCHSWDAISKDTNHGLAASKGHDASKEYRLGWRINSDDLGRKVYFNGTPHQVFEKISIVELDKMEGDPYILRNYAITDDPTGEVLLNKLSTVKSGKKYQIVVHSPSRGDISSRAITIPNIPDLKMESFSWGYAPHFQESPGTHTNLNIVANMTLKADATLMGHMQKLPEGNFHFGAWRTVAPYVPYSLRADAQDEEDDQEANPTVLLHHIGGVQTDTEDANCGACAQETSVTTNADGTITLSDYFHHERGVNNTYSYDTRLYVKVPDEMIPGDERWMAVDAFASDNNIVVSGIDEVVIDQILTEMQTADDDLRWYDLEGRPVANPVAGKLYIRASRTEANVVVAP